MGEHSYNCKNLDRNYNRTAVECPSLLHFNFYYFPLLLTVIIILYFVDFSEQRITSLLNYELADNLGNMVNRVTGVKINPLQTYPCFHLDLFPLSGPTPQGRAMAEDYKLLDTMSTLTGKFSRGEVDSR